MGVAFVFYVLLTLSVSLKSYANVIPNDDFVRCAQSCLKIIPFDSQTENYDQPQMIKHCAKLTPDGKCACDWEKILTDGGDCVCRNKLKKIDSNNQCICDFDKCKPPMKDCKLISEANYENCICPKYKCNGDDDVCPEGSYRSNQTQDGGCLCYPCKSSNCKELQRAVVIIKGTHEPGSCCDIYRCDNLHLKKTCEKDGHNYTDGQIWTQNDCSVFKCENGIIYHELKEGCVNTHPCFFKDLVYKHGESWFEDECTNCTCVNGYKKCMAHFCKDPPAVTIPPKAECPYVGGCRKKCPFGLRLNRQGCQTCKCRQPDAKTIQEILRAVNCTPDNCDLVHILPSNCSTWKNIAAGDTSKCADNFTYISLAVLVAVLTFVCIILSIIIWYNYRCQVQTRKRSSSEYQFKPMLDANLNTEKPVLCKSVESKDYAL